jgi:hypothetical protein
MKQINSGSTYENQSSSEKKQNSKINLFDFAEEIKKNMELDQKSNLSSVKREPATRLNQPRNITHSPMKSEERSFAAQNKIIEFRQKNLLSESIEPSIN